MGFCGGVGGGGGVCTVIIVLNQTTVVRLCCVVIGGVTKSERPCLMKINYFTTFKSCNSYEFDKSRAAYIIQKVGG